MAAPRASETNSSSSDGRSATSGRRRAGADSAGVRLIGCGAAVLPKPTAKLYSRYVGRVGALAVALGVGAAVASMPAVAFADSTESAGSTGSSSSSSSSGAGSSGSSESGGSSAASGSDASDAEATDFDASDAEATDFDASDVEATDIDASDVEATDFDASDVEATDFDASDVDDSGGASGSVIVPDSPGLDSSASARRGGVTARVPPVPLEPSASDEGEIAGPDPMAGIDDGPSGPSDLAEVAMSVVSSDHLIDAGTPDAVAAVPEMSATASNVIVAEPVSGLWSGAPASDNGLDVPAAALGLATLGFASRRETNPSGASVASQQGVSELANLTPQASLLADPADTNVLLIGIDGTRLQAILDDPENVNLFALMAGGDIVTPDGITPIVGGTTAASTIVGHTTISLPSWTTILGGVWGEETGVINNVFYPETADEYPTLFNTLETTFGDNIQTMAIANWVGTAAISDAESLGTSGADVVQYVEDFENDPIWTQSDDRIAELTVQAIEGTNPGCGGPCPVPDFLFSYFVGVDNTGHEFGGGSPEYAEALRNVDENVGEIMEAVVASGEDWIVIVVTDHGQSTMRDPIGALAHGFQTPEETTTFVIGWDSGNNFEPGAINNQYSILDISPTVLDLFGGPDLPPPWYEGVPLSDHDASTVTPVDPDGLRVALLDAIGMYGYPDVVTQLSLSMRTIFATVPMVIYDLTNDIIAAVEDSLPSSLSWLVTVPVQIIGDLLYMATNVPAQIVARLTGVTGASIFPLLPPEPPSPPLAPAPSESPDLLPNPGAEVGVGDSLGGPSGTVVSVVSSAGLTAGGAAAPVTGSGTGEQDAAPQLDGPQLPSLAARASLLADPADTNVVVLGIDGTNLQAILDDPANVNLFALMAGGDIVTPNGTTPIVGGTTAASTIVGHTTISLPSWTTILDGVWGEESGVINNVFYPETADEYPTAFNTLEATFGDNIQTMAIANWAEAAAIPYAESLGTPGADVVQYVEGFENDPIWTQRDDRVAELTVQAIEGTNPGCGGPCPIPNFLFSYLGGVDEAGHQFGGGSPQQSEALRNADENVGEIMEAIVASGEDWTVIVTTDHGQSTGRAGALAHGFQSPEETTTFVIGWDSGNNFEPGAINNQYSILDISPTVLDLFGGPDLPPPWYEGVPLSDHDASTVTPVDPDGLRVALLDAIGMYGYPDIVTDWNLNWRTIFATPPYLVFNLTNDIIAAVEDSLPSSLSWLVTVPVQIIGDLLYMATNVPAQIVARLTGVTGASIFPLLPPEPPSPPLAPAPSESPDLLVSLGAELV